MKNKTVLLVDDDKKVLFLLADALENVGFSVRSTTVPSQALHLVQHEPVDAVLLDLLMPGIDGLETLQAIKKIRPHLPVILLSGHGTIEKAVAALKLGAYDFLEKSICADKIAVTLKNAITQATLEQEKTGLLETMQEEFRMIGVSPVMVELQRLVERMAPTDSPVLITGENGTGKELIARALHFSSPRAARPFVAINAAAIPENLVESELFGHEKGAFTDASAAKPGIFELADTGTLFIDEIAQLGVHVQPKLFRALEYREIQRVGGTSSKKVDIRVVCATNTDLKAAIKAGRFREDLYFRIAVLTVDVPPLRRRVEDIPLLVDHFARRFCLRRKRAAVTFHARSLELLMAYPWPGNIRELRNIIEKVLILSDQTEILPDELRQYLPQDIVPVEVREIGDTLDHALKKAERETLLATLRAMAWNYENTAAKLGISRATLFNKLKAHHISSKQDK